MKQFIIFFWKSLQWFFLIVNKFNYLTSNKTKVYYCGAFSGNYGGAYVKIQRMQKFLKEHLFQFNVAYILSNSIYLSSSAIQFLPKIRVPLIMNQHGVFYPGW